MNDFKDAENDAKQTEKDLADKPAAQGASEAAAQELKAGGEALPEVPDPAVVLQNLRLENAELKDKLLRTLAEMENLRRRTEREIAEAKTYGVASFARDMLTVADNLRRALQNVAAGAREKADDAWKSLAEGIEVTERDFLSRLTKYGVRKLEPLGAKFDPHLHEALFEMPDDTTPNGTVVHIIEDGYVIGDRVLRPAKVGVSRGGPKAANENAGP
jgi:molecular chaperone GrpE